MRSLGWGMGKVPIITRTNILPILDNITKEWRKGKDNSNLVMGLLSKVPLWMINFVALHRSNMQMVPGIKVNWKMERKTEKVITGHKLKNMQAYTGRINEKGMEPYAHHWQTSRESSKIINPMESVFLKNITISMRENFKTGRSMGRELKNALTLKILTDTREAFKRISLKVKVHIHRKDIRTKENFLKVFLPVKIE